MRIGDARLFQLSHDDVSRRLALAVGTSIARRQLRGLPRPRRAPRRSSAREELKRPANLQPRRPRRDRVIAGVLRRVSSELRHGDVVNRSGRRGQHTHPALQNLQQPRSSLRHDEAYYDSKCFACHLANKKELKTEARNAPACPVSAKQCASCHMPKIELPEMHYKFTDHWIRIAKPGEPTPR